MGFLGIKKPFQKESVNNYTNILVPLANAKRHDTVIADYERRRSAENLAPRASSLTSSDAKKESDAGVGAGADVGRNEKSLGNGVYSPNTIEGLRAEVYEDMARSGEDSAYDLKSTVINKAIQDIGMGRYNWELFVSCIFLSNNSSHETCQN